MRCSYINSLKPARVENVHTTGFLISIKILEEKLVNISFEHLSVELYIVSQF